MADKKPFLDRLEERLEGMGVTRRKAKELSKGLVATFGRKSKDKVSVRIVSRLMNLGLTELKAKELAKGLVPTVNAALKAKKIKIVKAKARKAGKELTDAEAAELAGQHTESDKLLNSAVEKFTDETEDAELDKVAPRVNGHRLRLDMPVLPYRGDELKGIDVLRVMNGLTTTASYIVASVKGDIGIVAVRQFGANSYKLKFYPTFEYWGRTREELSMLGAHDYLNRGPYERMMFSASQATAVLDILQKEAAPRKRIKALLTRMKTLSFSSMEKAFGFLHKRVAA